MFDNLEMLNRFSIDYVTITVRNMELSEILFDLGLLNINFQKAKGFDFYRERLTFCNMSFLYNGLSPNMGICINFSGEGCRAFETFGNGDWLKLLSYVTDYEMNNCTRLDLAYDDFNGVLPLKDIAKDFYNGNYISYCKGGKIDIGVGNQKGMTVYIGSRSSEFLCRFYDKAAERGVEDKVSHWVRAEIQLGKSLTAKTIQDLTCYTDIKTTFFKIMNHYIRFIEPFNDENGNKSRDSVIAPYWSNFIGDYGRMSVFTKQGYQYSEKNLKNYVFNQAGGAIWTYLQMHSVSEFLEELKIQDAKEKNPRYRQLLEKFDNSVEYIFNDKEVV